MATAQKLENLDVRWYNPEYFPTVDLQTVSDTGVTAGIQGYSGNTIDYNLDACDVAGNWGDKFSESGGGGVDLSNNPTFPSAIRLTVCVQRDDINFTSNLAQQSSLGGQSDIAASSVNTLTSIDTWNTYVDCIDTCVDEACDSCGDDLGFFQGNTGSIINIDANASFSVCHKDIQISGWNGSVGQNPSPSEGLGYEDYLSYQGSNQDPDADYILTEEDVTDGSLDILSGTEFGKDGAYEAAFNIGDRVRIFGARPSFFEDFTTSTFPQVWLNSLQPNLVTGESSNLYGGLNDINRLFRGEFPWTSSGLSNYEPSTGNAFSLNNYNTNSTSFNSIANQSFQLVGPPFSSINPLFQGNTVFNDPFITWWPYIEGNPFGKPEDIDGVGFHSPFFYNLWGATKRGVSTLNIVEDFLVGSPTDPLNPDLIDIKQSNIYNRIDSRIKYVIFQNTLGMMNDGSGFTPGESSWYQADFGKVPIENGNVSGADSNRHNKVHVYIVFREEWAGEQVTYAAGDSRSQVKIDLDGMSVLVNTVDSQIFSSVFPT